MCPLSNIRSCTSKSVAPTRVDRSDSFFYGALNVCLTEREITFAEIYSLFEISCSSQDFSLYFLFYVSRECAVRNTLAVAVCTFSAKIVTEISLQTAVLSVQRRDEVNGC